MGVEVVDKIVRFRSVDSTSGYGIDFRSNPYNDIVLVRSLPENEYKILQSASFTNYNGTWYTLYDRCESKPN